MPMFAFISGWFSKEEIDFRKNVKQLLPEDNIPQTTKDELFDAQAVSDIFERDFRRYSCMFETDLGGTKI